MDKESKEYLSKYIKLTPTLIEKIERHIKRYQLGGRVVAYYDDWEDFCGDWNRVGYTRTEARKLFHGGIGEFMKLPDSKAIIRFSI